jgi:hypothetical protein
VGKGVAEGVTVGKDVAISVIVRVGVDNVAIDGCSLGLPVPQAARVNKLDSSNRMNGRRFIGLHPPSPC